MYSDIAKVINQYLYHPTLLKGQSYQKTTQNSVKHRTDYFAVGKRITYTYTI
jgi:hypothetical protein